MRMDTRKWTGQHMGRLIVVRLVLERCQERNLRWWKVVDMEEARAGWIVGLRRLKNGEVKPGYYDEPSSFATTSTVQTALVAWWPTETPVSVPLDGFELIEEPRDPLDVVKFPYPSSGYGSGQTRRNSLVMARQHSRDWDRADNGRWTGLAPRRNRP